MKVLKTIILLGVIVIGLSSCGVSNKSIQRYMKMEEGVDNPTSVEELKDAISKYSRRVSETQMAMGQIGIWYKMLGTRYIEYEMYGEALKCFQEALNYYPNNANLYYYVGICAGYMSHKELDYNAVGSNEKKYNYLHLSEEAYLRALEIDDRYTNAMYGIGVLYVYELDESEKAIPYLEKLLTIDTRHMEAMAALARAYYCCYEFDKSVAMYDKIISTSNSAERKALAQNLKQQVLEALDAAYGN